MDQNGNNEVSSAVERLLSGAIGKVKARAQETEKAHLEAMEKFKTQAQQKKGSSGRGTAYSIEKEGAGQLVVVGPPNTGKSSLVAALTNATPEIAEFPHSTWKPTPGMVNFENIQFQLIDTPPLSKDYTDPWMADLIRRTDILILLFSYQFFTKTSDTRPGIDNYGPTAF